jgi:hypothetical protein
MGKSISATSMVSFGFLLSNGKTDLAFKEVYFNDEGEYLIKEIEPQDTSEGQFYD